MQGKTPSCTAFVFTLVVLFAHSPAALGQRRARVPGLGQVLGTHTDAYCTDAHLAAASKESVVTAGMVYDPSKLSSSCLKDFKEGDGVESINLGSRTLRLTHLSKRNGVTYDGLFAAEETDLTQSDDPSPKACMVDLSVGLGRLGGDTTYQTGGTFSTPEGSGEVPFPVSELEFPLDVYMVSLDGSIEFAEKWKVSAGFKKNITDDAGKMKDSDWGVYWLEGEPGAEQGTLDVYSESDAALDALVMNVKLRYRFFEGYHGSEMYGTAYKKVKWYYSVGVGFMYQDFDYEVSNLHQWYPSSSYYFGVDSPHDRVSGRVLTYEVTYRIAYLEFAVMARIRDRLRLEASLGYSPMVDAEDEDHHLLRSKVYETDYDYGNAVLFSFNARYYFTIDWFVGLQFDYTEIEAGGKSKSYIDGMWSATIDQETDSRQIFSAFTIGYVF